MTIPLPRLDDKSYAELLDSSLKLIPSLYPDWTNFNESDPGVTLVEMFAWLTEMLLYRLDQIPPGNYVPILKLIDPTGSIPAELQSPSRHDPKRVQDVLDSTLSQAILKLRTRYRAITTDDYEWLLLNEWQASQEARRLGISLWRVYCVPLRDLTTRKTAEVEAKAHISVVLIAHQEGSGEIITGNKPGSDLIAAVSKFLEPRRLLTTQLHVVLPRPIPINLSLTIKATSRPRDLAVFQTEIVRAVASMFHPLTGGKDQRGWPLGRAVYHSEVYALADRLPGVASVTITDLTSSTAERSLVAEGKPVGIRLLPDEYPVVAVTIEGVTS
ncbi:MAG: hypothetical protein J0M33_11545 [Anaerolineae bacterium]|nr:hypothetical protein [Anaerolineae bacterium]